MIKAMRCLPLAPLHRLPIVLSPCSAMQQREEEEDEEKVVEEGWGPTIKPFILYIPVWSAFTRCLFESDVNTSTTDAGLSSRRPKLRLTNAATWSISAKNTRGGFFFLPYFRSPSTFSERILGIDLPPCRSQSGRASTRERRWLHWLDLLVID